MVGIFALLLLSPQPFSFTGEFFEGCSCKQACAFELTGKTTACNAAGFYAFKEGRYGGESFSGTEVAFVAGASGWIQLFVDGPTVRKRETAKRFISAALKSWGKPEAIEILPIDLAHKENSLGGEIMHGSTLTLEVRRKKGDEVHSGIFNKLLHPTIIQGSTVICRFKGAKHKFTFQDSNGFYNTSLKVSGRV
jgi:hypothetical protein